MKSFVLALRAIGTQLAIRLYIPAAIFTAIVLTVIVAGALWLTTLSDWWWLLFFPITVIVSVAIGVATALLLLIRFVRPEQTKAQKKAVTQFVDKLQGITDIVGTPKFFILFRVVRSIAAPSKDTFLSDIVKNRELAKEFKDIQRSFDSRL